MSREEIEPAAAITYETVFLAEPEIPTEQVDQIISKLKETIAAHQGSVASEDRWGRRRLAYPIHGHREGFYSVLTFSAEPTVVAATIMAHVPIPRVRLWDLAVTRWLVSLLALAIIAWNAAASCKGAREAFVRRDAIARVRGECGAQASARYGNGCRYGSHRVVA